METTKLLHIKDLCAIYGVCRRTVYNWLDKGLLTVVRTPAGTPRIVVTPAIQEAIDIHNAGR